MYASKTFGRPAPPPSKPARTSHAHYSDFQVLLVRADLALVRSCLPAGAEWIRTRSTVEQSVRRQLSVEVFATP